MSAVRLRYPASAIAAKNRIGPEDILLLRKHMFPHGLLSIDDAEQLLALHRAATHKCCEWQSWFVETMAAFIAGLIHPETSLHARSLQWIEDMFAPYGRFDDEIELELVLHSMERADFVPEQLSCLLLDQVRLAVRFRQGAYAALRSATRRGLAQDDMEYLFRVLRKSLSLGKFLLTKRELAVLDRLDTLVRGEFNDPRWGRFTASVAIRRLDGASVPTPWLTTQLFDYQDEVAA